MLQTKVIVGTFILSGASVGTGVGFHFLAKSLAQKNSKKNELKENKKTSSAAHFEPTTNTITTVGNISCTHTDDIIKVDSPKINYFICSSITFPEQPTVSPSTRTSNFFKLDVSFKPKPYTKMEQTKGLEKTTPHTPVFYGLKPLGSHPQQKETFFLINSPAIDTEEKQKNMFLKIKTFRHERFKQDIKQKVALRAESELQTEAIFVGQNSYSFDNFQAQITQPCEKKYCKGTGQNRSNIYDDSPWFDENNNLIFAWDVTNIKSIRIHDKYQNETAENKKNLVTDIDYFIQEHLNQIPKSTETEGY